METFERLQAVYDVALALSDAAMVLVQGGRRAEAQALMRALRLHQQLHGLEHWRDLVEQMGG